MARKTAVEVFKGWAAKRARFALGDREQATRTADRARRAKLLEEAHYSEARAEKYSLTVERLKSLDGEGRAEVEKLVGNGQSEARVDAAADRVAALYRYALEQRAATRAPATTSRAAASPRKRGAKKSLPQGVTSYRSRDIRKLGYDLFFACDHPLIGTELPGRGGGKITGCVTPSKKHPKELQLHVGTPNVGKPFRLSTVRDRLRGKTARGEGKTASEERRASTQEAVERFRVDGIPFPVGRVYPGREGSSRCDPSHPLWSDYAAAMVDAEEGASIMFDDPENVSERDFREAIRTRLKAYDGEQFARWDSTTRACVESYEKKFPRAKGYESPQAEMGRKRAAFLRAGGDTGSGEWDDFLSDATRAAKKRAAKKGGKR